MEDPRLKIGDPRYPPSLQKAFIGYFLGTFQSFTDEEIDELTEFFRQLWVMREQQGVRLELIKVLKLVLAKKIEDEKHMLRDQLKKLESM